MYKVFFKDRTVFLGNEPAEFRSYDSIMFYRYAGLKFIPFYIQSFFELEDVKHFFLFHEDIEELWKDFYSFFTCIEAGGGLVRNPEGEVLMIFRNGIWDLPKGKADPGEEIMETAIREVKEECNLIQLVCREKVIDTYHCYYLEDTPIIKKTTWFDMFFSGDEEPKPQTGENITDLRWITGSDLNEILKNTFPSIIEVLKQGRFLA